VTSRRWTMRVAQIEVLLERVQTRFEVARG
jgi:hypothetical protein